MGTDWVPGTVPKRFQVRALGLDGLGRNPALLLPQGAHYIPALCRDVVKNKSDSIVNLFLLL